MLHSSCDFRERGCLWRFLVFRGAGLLWFMSARWKVLDSLYSSFFPTMMVVGCSYQNLTLIRYVSKLPRASLRNPQLPKSNPRIQPSRGHIPPSRRPFHSWASLRPEDVLSLELYSTTLRFLLSRGLFHSKSLQSRVRSSKYQYTESPPTVTQLYPPHVHNI